MSTLEAAPLPTNEETRYPSLLIANIFLLLGIGIILIVSYFLDGILPPFWMSSLAEFALAAITLIFVRAEKLPLKKTLRWRWPGWQPVVLGALLAVGVWIMSVGINLTTALLFGYTAPVPPSNFPKNIGGAIALAVATMIAAPLCEEVMFRGYILRTYERWGTWAGILISSGLFALYHLRFQGLFALIPVSLMLGIIAWRSDSLWPGIIMHATFNGIATVLMTMIRFLPIQIVGALIAMVVCAALLLIPLALVGLWYLWRITAPPRPRPPQPTSGRLRLLWIAPLIVLAGVYAYSAFAEIIVGRFPETLAESELTLSAPETWDTPQTWTYIIHNATNEAIGEATCDLEHTTKYTLFCQAEHDAYDMDIPMDIPQLEDFFHIDAHKWTQTTEWSPDNLHVQIMSGEETRADTHFAYERDADGVRVPPGTGEAQTPTVPDNALWFNEWAWRLGQMPLELGMGVNLPYVWLDDNGTVQVSDAYVGVAGGEPLWTPADNYIAWKVTLTYQPPEGDEVTLSAWYDEETPHTLLGYSDGDVTYLLSD